MRRRHRTLVLMYHGLGTVPAALDAPNNFVPVAAFAAQMDHLQRRGFTAVDEATYLDMLDGGPGPARPVLITFDDGYVSVLQDAAPVLQRRRMPALCYVSPGLSGHVPGPGESPAKQLMDDDQMRALPSRGIDLGCHSWVHDSMRGMAAPALAQATTAARTEIFRISGEHPRTFAYPFGHHDARAREAVRTAGFEAAFATYDGHGRHALPRVDVNTTDTLRSFDLKLRRAYPAARQALSAAPAARRLAHSVVGYAPRA